MFELAYTCERCFRPVGDEVGATPPLDTPIICGACLVAQELSEEQRRALEDSAITEVAEARPIHEFLRRAAT